MMKKLRARIKEMRKVFRIYKVVKLVSKLTDEHEKMYPSELKNSGYDVWHPGTARVKKEFAKKRGISIQTANSTVASAIREGYLVGRSSNKDGVEVDIVCISVEKGTDLLDDVPGLPFIKIGLLEAIWEKHGRFLSGVVVGVFLPLLIALCKWLLGVIIERYGQ